MSEAVTPSEGWGVLHLFWRVTAVTDREAVIAAVKAAQADGHQVVSFVVLGHKADLGTMALGPDLWRLHRLQADLVAAGLDLTASYVSLTEVSEYARGMPAERLEPRLHPQLPPEGKRVLCFYPMSKRRDAVGNWYTLPYEEREQLMYGHGKKGREFAGRVLQLVTGSTGLDDWEWAVTLFADDPLAIKQCVHELRFDTASAVYAEFGPFLIGLLAPIDEVLRRVALA
ncbi:MAG TPA: chlorite dismutase family protein [Acidimicrobiales bacterium]|nr:chlorite dismutase family protein [Acidimicrobiia bacterium]HEV3400623.1 chlorite dismutase family protein [Acidimicrobiales bacterium]